jgi:hypothetical protein
MCERPAGIVLIVADRITKASVCGAQGILQAAEAKRKRRSFRASDCQGHKCGPGDERCSEFAESVSSFFDECVFNNIQILAFIEIDRLAREM